MDFKKWFEENTQGMSDLEKYEFLEKAEEELLYYRTHIEEINKIK